MSEGLVELRGEVGRLSQELVETREAIPIPPDLDLEGGLSLGWLEEDPRPLRRQSVQMEGPLRRVVLETSISTSPVSRFSGGERTFWDHLMGGE